jgi:hypothetical protein
MTISDPNGPFGFNFWLHTHETNSLGAGEDLEAGDLNQLTPGDDGNATVIANDRHDNLTLAGRNLNTGPNVVGIYGDSAGTQGVCVGVVGACDTGGGVCGIAMAGNAEVTALPSSVGVFGAGDFHGVYGASAAVAGRQPDLKTFGHPNETVAMVGANGTSSGIAHAPTILGLNGILADDLSQKNFRAVTDDIIQQPAGAEGVCVNGFGVVGVSFAPGPQAGDDLPVIDPPVRQQLNSPIDDPIDPSLPENVLPAGVAGLSQKGPGIRGISAFDRGGIFQSATGIAHDGVITVNAPPIAQIRLVPFRSGELPDSEQRDRNPPGPVPARPKLPVTGNVGDLFALVARDPNGQPTPCSLWFCLRTGGPEPDFPRPAQWAQVALFDRPDQLVDGSI